MRQKNYLFPGFDIIQDDEYFKLSQDSVLLGAFADLRKNERIIDLGCGIGVLLMIMLIRHPKSTGIGVEITEGAAELARENLSLCSLEERGSVINGDFKNLPNELTEGFDVCISNPPYFEASRGFSSPKTAIAAARNQSRSDIYDVCSAASRCLKWGGRFYVCFPPAGMAKLMSAMDKSNLEPKRMRFVHTKTDKAPCLVMIEARKGGGEGLSVMPPLIIWENGSKTEEFKQMYRLNKEEI